MKDANDDGLLYGLIITFIVAVLSFLTWWFLKSTVVNFSALLWAFVYSIIITNLLPNLSSGKYIKGINFASSKLLRFSIAILGITVSAAVWLKLGIIGIICTLIVIFFAFFCTPFHQNSLWVFKECKEIAKELVVWLMTQIFCTSRNVKDL